jgi:ABC-2 type transport system permease protein
MWERIAVILRKEFSQVLREPRMRLLLFVPPLVQLIVFGFAVNLDVDHARIAWMDMDGTPASRTLRDRFTGSGRFQIVAVPANEADVQRVLDHGDAQAVVRVLPGFARDLDRGRPTQVQVLVDGTNSNTASLVASYAGSVIAEFSADQMKRRINVSTPAPNIVARSRVWFNPDLYSRNYFVPGVIANIIMLVTLMLTSKGVAGVSRAALVISSLSNRTAGIALSVRSTIPSSALTWISQPGIDWARSLHTSRT